MVVACLVGSLIIFVYPGGLSVFTQAWEERENAGAAEMAEGIHSPLHKWILWLGLTTK